MNRITRFAAVSVALTLQAVPPLHAQVAARDAETPRTRTLPGTESPAFPYAEPEEVGLSSEKLDRLGDEITAWVANGDLVGAELLVVKDGRAVFHEAYGWADREDRRPMERNSLFSIKSMSKPFTAMAVLMLAEEGKLSLSDPVSRYIPTYAGDERTTIRDLLAHTSGYEGLGTNIASFDTLEEWVADWASRPPAQPFGAFSYSDFNYAALGRVVEVASGAAPDTFIEDRIIGPLGLDETYTSFDPDAPWTARSGSGYAWNDEAWDYDRYRTHRDAPGWVFYPAAWGLWATAMDYAEFLTLWLNGGEYDGTRLLPEATVEEALRPHALLNGQAMYGYGWSLDGTTGADGQPSAFSHSGYDGTVAMAFPADDAVVVYLTQSRRMGPGHLYALQNWLAMLDLFAYTGPGMEWADRQDVAEVELSPDELARYVGTYRGKSPLAAAAPDLVVRVWDDGGRLHLGVGTLGAEPDGRQHLVPFGDHRFVQGRYDGERLEALDPHAAFRFVVEDGQAVSMEATYHEEVEFVVERTDPDRLAAEVEAERRRVRIDRYVLDALDAGGVQSARALHRDLLASRPDSVRFGEGLLNALGYRLLEEGRTEESVAVFEMNVEAYPEAANPYDSLADAYLASGRLEDARRSYERAVALAEQQGHQNLEAYRGRLERVTQQLERQ